MTGRDSGGDPRSDLQPVVHTKPQGSGLGLAIVRKIVDAHEGRIDVTTESGRGTTSP